MAGRYSVNVNYKALNFYKQHNSFTNLNNSLK